MEVRIISQVLFLSFDESQDYSFLDYTLKKISDSQEIKNFYGENSLHYFGKIYLDASLNIGLFTGDFQFETISEIHRTAQRTHMLISSILNFAWLIKDNSFTAIDTGYNIKNHEAYHVSRSEKKTLSSGETRNVSMTLQEWNKAIEYLNIYSIESAKPKIPIEDIKTPVGYSVTPSAASQVDYNLFNRLNRSISFLNQARSTSFLPSKISNYILLAECLFSADDSKEISHKIAQRIANYIGDSISDKKEIFKLIKKAYDVRSRYLHGQTLSTGSKTNDVLRDISFQLDSVMRRVMCKVFTEPQKFTKLDNKALSEWLDENMFGKETFIKELDDLIRVVEAKANKSPDGENNVE